MTRADTGLPAIVTDDETMSGEPCLEGTRIPVGTVLANLRAGHSAEAISAAYPTLPVRAVEAAMAWAEDNGVGWRPAGGGTAPRP